ncbi:hypothetical protein GCM10009730_54850 [Streptomyces albidochromogenes]
MTLPGKAMVIRRPVTISVLEPSTLYDQIRYAPPLDVTGRDDVPRNVTVYVIETLLTSSYFHCHIRLTFGARRAETQPAT